MNAMQRRCNNGVRWAVLTFIIWGATGSLLPVSLASDRTGQVLVRTVESDPIEGRLISLSLTDGVVVQSAGKKESVAADAWIRLTPLSLSDDSKATANQTDRPVDEVVLVLSYGDRLVGRIVDEAKDAVVVETADLGRVTVPLDELSRVSTAHAAKSGHRDADAWFKKTTGLSEDAVLLTNGDVVRGFVTRLAPDGVSLDAATGATTIPLRLVVAAKIVHPPPKRLDPPFARVRLKDTSQVTATTAEGDDQHLTLTLQCGTSIRTRLDRIESMECATRRWEWLTQLRPISAEQVPLFTQGWDHIVDRNVRGGPLRVAGESFDRGLGVHARSVLVYELGGEYSEFVTAFGLDDDSGPLADVTVAVLVDGRPRFQASGVRRGVLSGPIRVDVTRAGRIELVVDFGENGDIQDRFNWIEPALVR